MEHTMRPSGNVLTFQCQLKTHLVDYVSHPYHYSGFTHVDALKMFY